MCQVPIMPASTARIKLRQINATAVMLLRSAGCDRLAGAQFVLAIGAVMIGPCSAMAELLCVRNYSKREGRVLPTISSVTTAPSSSSSWRHAYNFCCRVTSWTLSAPCVDCRRSISGVSTEHGQSQASLVRSSAADVQTQVSFTYARRSSTYNVNRR